MPATAGRRIVELVHEEEIEGPVAVLWKPLRKGVLLERTCYMLYMLYMLLYTTYTLGDYRWGLPVATAARVSAL